MIDDNRSDNFLRWSYLAAVLVSLSTRPSTIFSDSQTYKTKRLKTFFALNMLATSSVLNHAIAFRA
jgi:hypothetical protein